VSTAQEARLRVTGNYGATALLVNASSDFSPVYIDLKLHHFHGVFLLASSQRVGTWVATPIRNSGLFTD
jgi:hypothetical protein